MTRFIFKDNSILISPTSFNWITERVTLNNPNARFLCLRTDKGKEKCINLDCVKYFEEVEEFKGEPDCFLSETVINGRKDIL
jgi:hypothetical protein